MREAHPVATLLVVGQHLSVEQSPATQEEKRAYQLYAKGLRYSEIVGAVLYAAHTRPDISYAVSVIGRFSANLGKPHLEAAKRVLQYLKGTSDFGLQLGGVDASFTLEGWTDSDWAGDIDTRRGLRLQVGQRDRLLGGEEAGHRRFVHDGGGVYGFNTGGDGGNLVTHLIGRPRPPAGLGNRYQRG
jgi:hypothetical protein